MVGYDCIDGGSGFHVSSATGSGDAERGIARRQVTERLTVFSKMAGDQGTVIYFR